jgi:deazaflavin-dependent oxidoreductase (nitroreductase family)
MSKADEERRREVERMANDPNALDEINQRVIADFRANQGKVSGSALFEGMPVLLMTMTGAKSGRTLTRPVCYSRDGDALVIIASYGGAAQNPPWYHNLVANPVIAVEVGTEKFKARARVTSGAERQRLFDKAAREMPPFAEYQKKTMRELPVVVLNRID